MRGARGSRSQSNRTEQESRGVSALYSFRLSGLTLATCAEVEGEIDLNCNDADSYITTEGERSLQKNFGKTTVE